MSKPAAALKNMRVLYIEEQPQTREQNAGIIRNLVQELVVATDGLEGLRVFQSQIFHLVIADLNSACLSGLELATRIRRDDREVPIILTCTQPRIDDLLQSVRLNLTDFLVKPLSYTRIKEALHQSATRLLEADGLHICLDSETFFCPAQKTVLHGNESLRLTSKESSLLELLCKQHSRIVSRDQIAEWVYQEDGQMSDSALKNLVLKLRRKIGAAKIETIYSMGYTLHRAKN